MAKLTLSLGSNLGDRAHFLQEARRLLSERLGPLVYESKLLGTPAWGNVDQPSFLNQVVVVCLPNRDPASTMSIYLHGILAVTQQVEAALGRVRKEPWGPRTMDIDLIFLDDLLYEDERLSLPHPWWRERDFVVKLLPAVRP